MTREEDHEVRASQLKIYFEYLSACIDIAKRTDMSPALKYGEMCILEFKLRAGFNEIRASREDGKDGRK